MFESRTWYKETLILVVILPLASIAISLFIPIPYSWLFILILYIVVIISRIRKKALSGKEAITMILLSIGFNFVTKLFMPWPFSIILSVSLTFLIIWILHKRS